MVFDQRTHLTCGFTGGEVVDISGADHTCTSAARWLLVGTGGDVKVDILDDAGTTSTVTIPSVATGALLPFAHLTKIYQTGTDADNMAVFW